MNASSNLCHKEFSTSIGEVSFVVARKQTGESAHVLRRKMALP